MWNPKITLTLLSIWQYTQTQDLLRNVRVQQFDCIVVGCVSVSRSTSILVCLIETGPCRFAFCLWLCSPQGDPPISQLDIAYWESMPRHGTIQTCRYGSTLVSNQNLQQIILIDAPCLSMSTKYSSTCMTWQAICIQYPPISHRFEVNNLAESVKNGDTDRLLMAWAFQIFSLWQEDSR